MTRNQIERHINNILRIRFEFENVGAEDDLREVHGFDSIDAIELLNEIEILIGKKLSREEKERAFDIRTVTRIVDFVMEMEEAR